MLTSHFEGFGLLSLSDMDLRLCVSQSGFVRTRRVDSSHSLSVFSGLLGRRQAVSRKKH